MMIIVIIYDSHDQESQESYVHLFSHITILFDCGYFWIYSWKYFICIFNYYLSERQETPISQHPITKDLLYVFVWPDHFISMYPNLTLHNIIDT